MSLKAGHSIEAVTSVAGGNYSPTDRTGFSSELLRWREKGEAAYRPLVPFL
jgi:hypothetical protein